MSPPSIRGMVVSAKEIAVVLGMLCGYLVGQHFCGDGDDNDAAAAAGEGLWADVYGTATLVAVAMAACCRVVPESPRYLVMNSRCCPSANTTYEESNYKDGDDDDANNDDEFSAENPSSAEITTTTATPRRRSSITRSSSSSLRGRETPASNIDASNSCIT